LPPVIIDLDQPVHLKLTSIDRAVLFRYLSIHRIDEPAANVFQFLDRLKVGNLFLEEIVDLRGGVVEIVQTEALGAGGLLSEAELADGNDDTVHQDDLDADETGLQDHALVLLDAEHRDLEGNHSSDEEAAKDQLDNLARMLPLDVPFDGSFKLWVLLDG
jgi:hypothetical protein